MQWTVPQIIAELGHLDVQCLSFVERCEMVVGSDRKKLKAIRKWIAANNVMLAEILAELCIQIPAVHATIQQEQASAGIETDSDKRHAETRWRPSLN